MENDIEIIREYHPRLRDVATLQLKNIRFVLKACNFDKRWRLVTESDLYTFHLRRGTGILLFANTKGEDFVPGMPAKSIVHIYALWRGRDGDLVLFDSAGQKEGWVYPAVQLARERLDMPAMTQITYRWQGFKTSSCGYHVLSFVHFACTHSFQPSDTMLAKYKQVVGRTDLRAIRREEFTR